MNAVDLFTKDKIFILGLLLLLLLMFKNPFSGQNVISDLEPSPDTIHYLTTTRNLLEGKGLKIIYQGRELNPTVPPLYSFVLLPLYALFNDPRAFYITNTVLTILSVTTFYIIISKLFSNPVIRTLIFFTYITNYVVFWYPTTAMAENLLIFLFLASIWLILNRVSLKKILFAASIVVGFYATKYTAITLSLSFGSIYLTKIIFDKTKMPEKITNLVIYFTTGITIFALLSIFDYFNKGSNVFHTAEYMLASHTLHFSFTYAKINLIRYLAGFMGGPISVAGLDFIILPIGVGMVSLFSMIFNVFIQKNRLINLYLFLSVVCTLVFISAFRIVDGRYVFISIPALIIVFGTTLNWLYLFFKSIKRKYVSYGLLIFSIIGIVSSNYSQVKNELYANFYDSKKPLNYQAILVLNKYFAATSKNPNKQVVITTLSPYIVDFYSNHNYGLLPLSKLQYFTDTPEITWGKNDYSDFVKLYSKYINQGYTLYVSDYKTGPGYFYNIDYQKIQHNFILERVASGCSSQCNLYKLSVKKISQHN